MQKRRISMTRNRAGKFIKIGQGQSEYSCFVPSPLPLKNENDHTKRSRRDATAPFCKELFAFLNFKSQNMKLSLSIVEDLCALLLIEKAECFLNRPGRIILCTDGEGGHAVIRDPFSPGERGGYCSSGALSCLPAIAAFPPAKPAITEERSIPVDSFMPSMI